MKYRLRHRQSRTNQYGSSCGAAIPLEDTRNQEKGEHMFFPHCHHFALFADPCALVDSMQLVSAYAVGCELQDRWRKEQIEQLEDEKKRTPTLRPY